MRHYILFSLVFTIWLVPTVIARAAPTDTGPLYRLVRTEGWDSKSQMVIRRLVNTPANRILGVAMTDANGLVLNAYPNENVIRGKPVFTGLPNDFTYNDAVLKTIWHADRTTRKVLWTLIDPHTRQKVKLLVIEAMKPSDRGRPDNRMHAKIVNMERSRTRNTWEAPYRSLPDHRSRASLAASPVVRPLNGGGQLTKWDGKAWGQYGREGEVDPDVPLEQTSWRCDLRYWSLKSVVLSVFSGQKAIHPRKRGKAVMGNGTVRFSIDPALEHAVIPRLVVQNSPFSEFLKRLAYSSTARIEQRGKTFYIIQIPSVKVTRHGSIYSFSSTH